LDVTGRVERSLHVCAESAREQQCALGSPLWSHDGSRIITLAGFHPRSLVSVEVASGRITTLTENDSGPCDFGGAEPSWSPDADSLVFEGGPRGGNICTVDAAGGSPRLLVRKFDSGLFTDFAWLPAGAISEPTAAPTTEAPAAIPLAPPPVGTIVFASTNASPDPEGSNVWLLSTDDPSPRMLTTGRTNARTPSLSPDGTRVVFTGNAEGHLQVWSVGIDGTGLMQLTDGRGASDPAWSPDGSQIAFRVDIGVHQTEGLYVMNADGTDQRLLWKGQPFTPTWTPDGTGITFAAESHDGSISIETVDLANAEERRIMSLPGSQYGPAWSPDGSRIAFLWDTPAGSGLYVANADGSNLVRARGTELVPFDRITWSPDGQWVAFEGHEDAVGPQIYVVRPDGSDLRRVTDLAAGPSVTGPDGAPGRTGDPSWGPTAG
jgi:TolB protein